LLVYGFGNLNAYLIEYLESKVEKKDNIRIFSGGNLEKQTKKLQKLGVNKKFLPVLSKSKFKGKIVEECIDDTNPIWQGFQTLKYKHPNGQLD